MLIRTSRIGPASLLTILALTGAAHAGTITAQGAVEALTNRAQMTAVIGTGTINGGANFSNIDPHLYSAQGLTLQVGNFSSILPGIVTSGVATNPIYYLDSSYFPQPIAGGGIQTAEHAWFGPVATFSQTVTQFGLTAGANGIQYLAAWKADGSLLGQVTWTPNNDSAFVGLDSKGVAIAMIAYGNDDMWSGQTYGVGGSTIMSDTWVWAQGCLADGQLCDDGNACTQTDTCQAGVCVGATPVVCAAQDQCHTAGLCDPGTGACSQPAKGDGSACDDGNGCTQTDTCAAGACVGDAPVVCAAQDQCHTAGACDPNTGVCSNPAAADDTACDDGNACTQLDVCAAGACSGAQPVVCPDADLCHDPGTCDPATGTCSNPIKPDGAACTDNDSCTNGDSCQAGVCTIGAPVQCNAQDECHEAGACSIDGTCSNPAKADGSPCSNAGTCQSGACTLPEAGAPDAGIPDAGTPDAGPPSRDAGAVADAGKSPTPAADGGTPNGDGDPNDPQLGGGCGCRTGNVRDSGSVIAFAALAMLGLRRRSRRH